MTSFEAHTVPIYWGNPYVAEEFNPEAFVNCMDYESFDEVVKRVKEIDEDDDLWAYMVSRPWQTEEQQKSSERLKEKYFKFVEHIFSQPLAQVLRRPEGFHPGNYAKWWFLCQKHFSRGNIYKFFTEPKLQFAKVKRKLSSIISRFSAKKLETIDVNDFFND